MYGEGGKGKDRWHTDPPGRRRGFIFKERACGALPLLRELLPGRLAPWARQLLGEGLLPAGGAAARASFPTASYGFCAENPREHTKIQGMTRCRRPGEDAAALLGPAHMAPDALEALAAGSEVGAGPLFARYLYRRGRYCHYVSPSSVLYWEFLLMTANNSR